MTSFKQHDYSDLLGEFPDQLQKTLIDDLDKAANRFNAVHLPVEQHYTIANALKIHTLQQVPVSRRFHQKFKQPTKKLAFAVALTTLSFVLLIGATLPNVAPLSQLLAWLDHTYGNNQAGKVVNLRQSTCGFTMTVKRIYANPAQMIVVFALNASENHHFIQAGSFVPAEDKLSLSDDYGHKFPISLNRPAAETINGNDTGQLLNFDISELTNIPEALSLHLDIPALYAGLYAGEVPKSYTSAGCETIQPTPPGVVEHSVRGATIHTNFKFNFTVPVQAGATVIHLNKTITSNGTSITLRRVVILPADGTLIYLKDDYGHIMTQLDATVNGKETFAGGGKGTDGTDEPGGEILDFESVPHGQWTLTFTSNPEMQGTDKFGKPLANLKGVKGGPWIFTFTTP